MASVCNRLCTLHRSKKRHVYWSHPETQEEACKPEWSAHFEKLAAASVPVQEAQAHTQVTPVTSEGVRQMFDGLDHMGPTS